MIEFLLPHLLNLDINYRNNILEKLIKRMPETLLSQPAQYINLLLVLGVKGDY